MAERRILDRTTTPDGNPLELTLEANGHYLIRVAGVPLMSSGTYGSEQAMATIARQLLGERAGYQVLVGGLGMGFTARAALDEFGPDAEITVAELLPAIVGYNRDVLGHLADHPLADPRLRLFEGDVREPIERGGWDALLMDVDQGPDAVTTRGNAALYGPVGAKRMARALAPGGILVVWSAYESEAFERTLRRAGLTVETRRVHARAKERKGARHTLFIGRDGRG